jgi:hypothetical protein
MAQNLFTDFPERVDQLKKFSELAQLSEPLEEAFGEKNFFKSSNEAMDFYFGVLEELGKLAATVIRPRAQEIDQTGAHFKDGEVTLPEALNDNIHRLKELGVFTGLTSRANGGVQLTPSRSGDGFGNFSSCLPQHCFDRRLLFHGPFR